MRKVYDNDNDDEGQRTNFDKKNSIEPSAQVSLKLNRLEKLENSLSLTYIMCVLVLTSKWERGRKALITL